MVAILFEIEDLGPQPLTGFAEPWFESGSLQR
jgi:hypothetical protein